MESLKKFTIKNKPSQEKIKYQYIFWYFIIFSIVGLIIETLFCYITTGVLESRKGFIIGPFCPIYGIGAMFLILTLRNFKLYSPTLFLGGFVVGSALEYLLSFILELMYGSRFWDYSYMPFNINGRICLIFSVYWGVLSILLLKGIRPLIDKLLNKLPRKMLNIIAIALLIFMIFNAIATVWAVSTYTQQATYRYYHLDETIQINTEPSFKNKIENTYFTDEFMQKTFPNLRIMTDEGEEVFIRDI